MRKEVERKINTLMCTHIYTQTHAHHNKVSVLWMGPTYKAAIYLYTKKQHFNLKSLNTWVSLPIKGKKRHKTTSFTVTF